MTSPFSRLSTAVILSGFLVLGLGLHHAPMADPRMPHDEFAPEYGPEEFEGFDQPDFRLIPLHEASRIATHRFRGRLIAARLRPPTPDERDHGVALVHELRLLTPRRDVLIIRLDARTGAFLEVRGAGLVEARRRNGDDE